MSQSKTSELEDYVRNIGKYLKNVDEHINIIYSKINDLNKKIKEVEDEVMTLKADSAKNANAVANLKENAVQKTDFDEFVGRLTESLRELLPPAAAATEEPKKE